MVVRKPNLLDAFREAAPERRFAESATPKVGGSGGGGSGAGGPFAPAPQAKPSAEAPPAEFRLPSDEVQASTLPGRIFADLRVRLVLLVAVLVGVGAYFAGRYGTKTTQAAGSSAVADSGGVLAAGAAAGVDAAEKNQAAARMGTDADKAFLNPANQFTVRLAQYKNDEAGLKLARETADYLRKQAIPVVAPISKGKWVILAAGAAPGGKELDALLRHAKALHGPPPREQDFPFASAYIDRIDAVVQRR